MSLDPTQKDLEQTTRKNKAGFSLSSLAGGGLVVLLIFGLGWAFRNLLPHPPAASAPAVQAGQGGGPVIPSTLATEPAPAVTTTGSEPATDVPLAANEYAGGASFPNTTLVMSTTFPSGPDQLMLYIQPTSTVTLTVDAARAVVEQLGVIGNVYIQPYGDPGEINYIVTDGKYRVNVLGSSDRFFYTHQQPDTSPVDTPLTFEQRVQIATGFLEQHGMLDFEYTVEPSRFYLTDGVRFSPLQNDLPVRFTSFANPAIDLMVNDHGQVTALDYKLITYQELGELPILSAEAAWQRAINLNNTIGVESYSQVSSSPSGDYNSWSRPYPNNQLVDLYTYLEILQPAEPDKAPFVALSPEGTPVQGNVDAITSQADQITFVHVWGQFLVQPDGLRVFELQDWESSLLQRVYLSGTIQYEGDQAYFTGTDMGAQAEDGGLTPEHQRYHVPELPAEVPTGEELSISGVILENPERTLNWDSIQMGYGGGGGGGGGGSFGTIRLEPGTPMEHPDFAVESPFKVAQRVEGVLGRLQISLLTQVDGSQKKEHTFVSDINEDQPDLIFATLEGEISADFDRLHNLPVKIWGEFSEVDEASGYSVKIRVERMEEAYPGLQLQAWLGTLENVTLDGKDVTVFTAQDGKQYVTGASYDVPQHGYIPEGQVLVEGYVSPEETLGDLSVLRETMVMPDSERENLEGYELETTRIYPMPVSPGNEGFSRIVITRIELVYLTYDLQGFQGGYMGQGPYVQPVWRYVGYYDGIDMETEILVQALPDAYIDGLSYPPQ